VPPSNDVDIFAHDLGYIAIVEKGKLVGYNVTVGGGYVRDFGANAVVFGVTVPLPIFNRNQGGVARAEAERERAAELARAAAIAVRLDVQQALNALEVNAARVAYIERELLSNARVSRDTVLASYRLGAADLIDYFDAQRAFRDTVRTHNQALYDYRISQFELAAAIGANFRLIEPPAENRPICALPARNARLKAFCGNSMSMDLRFGNGRGAFQKIEVAAFVGLLDVLDGRVVQQEQQVTLGSGGNLRRKICLGGLEHGLSPPYSLRVYLVSWSMALVSWVCC